MKSYEIYPLDEMGRICGSMRVDQVTDEEAVQTATRLLRPGQAAEVWQRDRKVGKVQAPLDGAA
jgi:hypothetical protein